MTIALQAYRRGKFIDQQTGKMLGFSLCGEDLQTDSLRFFAMLSGCERNVHLLIGKYSFRNDSFLINPFDFIREDAFSAIYKWKSSDPVQTIRFLSADHQPLKGRDSSWMVRCFGGRKEKTLDCSNNGVVTIRRGKYDGMELLQLSKIFGGPIVLFLDARFDYEVVVNQPAVSMSRYIKGATAIGGKAFIRDGCLYFEDDPEGLRIITPPWKK